jgi:uncharacterized protein (DUF2267 family)
MTMTGLDSIDKTLHKTNEWLGGVMDNMCTDDRKEAYQALRAVMHALRDRLPVEAVAGLGAQLPMLVRGIYYEGWHPHVGGHPTRVRTIDEFLAIVEKELPPSGTLDPERAVRAVLAVLRQRLDADEVTKVIHQLPKPLHELWGRPVEPRDS